MPQTPMTLMGNPRLCSKPLFSESSTFFLINPQHKLQETNIDNNDTNNNNKKWNFNLL